MKGASRKAAIAAAFGKAAAGYDDHATLQRMTARRLAERVAELPLPPRPRVLEIGCGTGFLTRALREVVGPADWTVTDLSPRMAARCRAALGDPADCRFLAMDGENPCLDAAGGFDLICSSLAMQWFGEVGAALARWARLLAPGGHIAFATVADGSLAEWTAAHADVGHPPGVLPFLPTPRLAQLWPDGGEGYVEERGLTRRHGDAFEFLAEMRGIGAHVPAEGRRPLPAGALRRLLRRFAAPAGINVTWRIAYGVFRRFPTARRGVFVTGTDTGVGKTLVSACLTRAWGASYWKPVQTGVATDTGDSETVAALAEAPAERLYAPGAVFDAPLSPHAAAALEGRRVTLDDLSLPADDGRPLVVEGAGGLLVPFSDGAYMIDLAEKLGLPVVLVARSGLGTINHTLLSLEALRRRRIPVAGVVMSGPLNPGNRAAIEGFGQVRVLAEIPQIDGAPDAQTVARLAETVMPKLEEILP